jgi:hypothetical protein
MDFILDNAFWIGMILMMVGAPLANIRDKPDVDYSPLSARDRREAERKVFNSSILSIPIVSSIGTILSMTGVGMLIVWAWNWSFF